MKTYDIIDVKSKIFSIIFVFFETFIDFLLWLSLLYLVIENVILWCRKGIFNSPYFSFLIFLNFDKMSFVKCFQCFLSSNKNEIIRIFNGLEVRIENSLTGATVRHHEACQVMPNSYPEWRNFQFALNSHYGLFFLHTLPLSTALSLNVCYFVNFTLKDLHFWSRKVWVDLDMLVIWPIFLVLP